MHTYRLTREQWIPRPIEEVFAFFCDATNLDLITPDWIHFRILSPTPIDMHVGTEIRYAIRWGPVPIRWITDIIAWEPPTCFVDVQRSGPYRLWHHTHRFEADGNRTHMIDEVRYALPLGPIGRAVHAVRVRRDLHAVFEYRRRRIDELFPPRPMSAPAGAHEAGVSATSSVSGIT